MREWKPDAIPWRRPKRAEHWNDQPYQQRHRLLYWAGEVRVEARSDRRSQERYCSQCDHRQSWIQKVIRLELVLVALAHVEGACRVLNAQMTEIRVPETFCGHNAVVECSILCFVAVGVARDAAQYAQDEEGDGRDDYLGVSADAIVCGERCQELEDEEGAGRKYVG